MFINHKLEYLLLYQFGLHRSLFLIILGLTVYLSLTPHFKLALTELDIAIVTVQLVFIRRQARDMGRGRVSRRLVKHLLIHNALEILKDLDKVRYAVFVLKHFKHLLLAEPELVVSLNIQDFDYVVFHLLTYLDLDLLHLFESLLNVIENFDDLFLGAC